MCAMSRIQSKQQLIDEILFEQEKLDTLLSEIPDAQKTKPNVVDGMSVKDILAHRTEWGRMFVRWYTDAKKGKQPDVPTKKHKWNQLKELNAEIYKDNKSVPLVKIEKDFKAMEKKLLNLIQEMKEKELLDKRFYDFTGTSTLAIYACSATASHYRSARRYIQKWWKAQQVKKQ